MCRRDAPKPPSRKTSFSKKQIDYITYDFQKHILHVGIGGQRLNYIGVPESAYLHLSLSKEQNLVFMEQIFNKYPVVIEHEKVSEAVQRRRRAMRRQSEKENPDSSE